MAREVEEGMDDPPSAVNCAYSFPPVNDPLSAIVFRENEERMVGRVLEVEIVYLRDCQGTIQGRYSESCRSQPLGLWNWWDRDGPVRFARHFCGVSD